MHVVNRTRAAYAPGLGRRHKSLCVFSHWQDPTSHTFICIDGPPELTGKTEEGGEAPGLHPRDEEGSVEHCQIEAFCAEDAIWEYHFHLGYEPSKPQCAGCVRNIDGAWVQDGAANAFCLQCWRPNRAFARGLRRAFQRGKRAWRRRRRMERG